MMLGSHYPELDCAEMNGTSSIDGCSLVDGPEAIAIAPEDTYMEGLNLKLADNEDDAGNDHRRTCRITDETVSLKPKRAVYVDGPLVWSCFSLGLSNFRCCGCVL